MRNITLVLPSLHHQCLGQTRAFDWVEKALHCSQLSDAYLYLSNISYLPYEQKYDKTSQTKPSKSTNLKKKCDRQLHGNHFLWGVYYMSFIYLFVYTQGIWSRIENLVTLWCLLWNMSIAAAQDSERAIVVVLLRTRLYQMLLPQE